MTRFIFIALLACSAWFAKPLALAQETVPNARFNVEVRGQGPDVVFIDV